MSFRVITVILLPVVPLYFAVTDSVLARISAVALVPPTSVRNSRALKPVKAEEEISDILGAAQSHPTDYKFLNITITDWKNYHSSLKKYDTHTIGLALKKLGIEQKRIRTGARLYSLPVWKNAPSSYDSEAC